MSAQTQCPFTAASRGSHFTGAVKETTVNKRGLADLSQPRPSSSSTVTELPVSRASGALHGPTPTGLHGAGRPWLVWGCREEGCMGLASPSDLEAFKHVFQWLQEDQLRIPVRDWLGRGGGEATWFSSLCPVNWTKARRRGVGREMESTLITAIGHRPGKRGKQKGTLSHWVQSLNYKKTSSKERKIRLGKRIKAQGSIEVATQLSYPETEAKPHRRCSALSQSARHLRKLAQTG